MILSFRNRALKRFWEKGDARGLNPQHVRKIELILDMLEDATKPEDMNLAKLDFHKLTGESAALVGSREWELVHHLFVRRRRCSRRRL